jgi:hypothetical protein
MLVVVVGDDGDGDCDMCVDSRTASWLSADASVARSSATADDTEKKSVWESVE